VVGESVDHAPAWLRGLVAAVQATPSSLPSFLRPPADGSGRRAAILVAFCDTADGPGLLLIERALGMRSHAGQAAFPGGAVDAGDTDAAATALREATEEVGLDPSSVRVLTTMTPRYLPPSDFVVTPVVAWWVEPHPVGAASVNEVARAVVVPVADLADPVNRFAVRSPRRDLVTPGFEIGDFFIWGFTAGLLDELLRLGGWEQPWDSSVVRPLPDSPLP
jgi:8-oxo-dGTP pyrophosphatase MutT (NUDIX family)